MEYMEEGALDYLNRLDKRKPELIKCDFCSEGFLYTELEEVRTTVKTTTYVEQACKGCLKEMKKYEEESGL